MLNLLGEIIMLIFGFIVVLIQFIFSLILFGLVLYVIFRFLKRRAEDKRYMKEYRHKYRLRRKVRRQERGFFGNMFAPWD
jgi:hypothetical protein